MVAEESRPIDRRVARTHDAVLGAARRLLFEGGPTALTYSALAEEAGVGRATLYRHWPTIDDLWSFISMSVTDEVAIEFTGDLRDDLIHAMQLAENAARSEEGRTSFATMLERSQWDDETRRFIEAFRHQSPVYKALARGVVDGTVPQSEDLAVATNLLLAPLMIEALFTRGDFSAALVEELVDRYLRAMK